jgi:hypothetical protein
MDGTCIMYATAVRYVKKKKNYSENSKERDNLKNGWKFADWTMWSRIGTSDKI